MKFKNSLKSFFDSNLVKKIKKVENTLKIKIYPKYFSNKGVKSIYTNFITKLILKEKLREYENYLKKELLDKSNVNLLISLPKSGSMATRLMINSYFEIYYKIGNGIPKYDSINHKWMFALNNIFSADLYNNLNLNKALNNYENYLSIDEYDKKKIFFSRYPLSNIDIINLSSSKPVIIIRDPIEQITSYCSRFNLDNLDKILLKACKNYINFCEFWSEHLRKIDQKKYLVIKYDEINTDPAQTLKKILMFFNYEINEDMIKTCAEIHTKNQTLKSLDKIKLKKSRFTDLDKKEKLISLVKINLKKMDKEKSLIDSYKQLSNI